MGSMFIKEIKKPNGSISVCIIESQRRGKKVFQKVIRTLGQHKDDAELRIVREAAAKLLIELENARNTVLPFIDPAIFHAKKKINKDPQLSNLREERRITEGGSEVIGSFYEQLGFDKVITESRKEIELNELLKTCVVSRILSPNSKRKMVKHLNDETVDKVQLHKVYRMMDAVYKNEERIKEKILSTTLSLFTKDVDVMFFDVTTLYFESFQPDELRSYGFSKDCKFKETQIVLGLVTNTEGVPITYEIFPGNTSEGKTLITVVKSMKEKYKVRDIYLVADRAMFNKNNLSLMESMDIKYIVACKLRSLSKKLKEKMLNDVYAAKVIENELHWVNEYEYEGKRLITNYSKKRAQKDKQNRQRLLDRVLKYAKDGKVNLSKLVNNHGSKKFLIIKKDEANISEEKIQRDTDWDGMHGVITNVKEKSAEEIISRYKSLWRIEEAFRINKNDLKMRPIYHWKPRRIRAHIAICFVAFAVLSYAKKKLKDSNINISVDVFKEEISKVQSSILKDRHTKILYKMPSNMTELQKSIYAVFGLKRHLVPREITN